jgi:hypothetical protein
MLFETDDQGTRVTDLDTGVVVRSSAGDHHDEWVAEWERGGWTEN